LKSSNPLVLIALQIGATSALGQSAKNAVRAHVFRFALELGHRATRLALRICANFGSDHHLVGAQVWSSEFGKFVVGY
jgi:hypothetical protein